MSELPIPPDANVAEQAIEIVRGWIIDEQLQCALLPTIWKDTPEAWGILLADLLSHIAQVIAQETDLTEDRARQIITKRLLEELGEPTTEHCGEFIDYD